MARIATASRPAFFAPGLPIASVATGTPPGICTIDSSESSPCSARALHRHAEHRQHGVRRDHAGQMGGAAGAGDDHLQALGLGARGELGHPDRRAVRRDDLLQVGHAELVEHGRRVRHRVPVGLRSHDDGDERCGHVGGLGEAEQLIKRRGPGIGDQGPGPTGADFGALHWRHVHPPPLRHRRPGDPGVPASAPTPGAQAPPRISPCRIQEFTLPNGLHVILHRDTSVPVVAVNVWYHVGSGNEKLGRTGFAHLFEHLMFEGSKHVPEGSFDTWLEGAGANNNGSTNTDRTNYYIDGPANALELMLFLESDRMGFLLDTMSPERVDGQRDVVKNERRQSYENRPYGHGRARARHAAVAEGPSLQLVDHRLDGGSLARRATRTCRSSSAPTTRRTTPAW